MSIYLKSLSLFSSDYPGPVSYSCQLSHILSFLQCVKYFSNKGEGMVLLQRKPYSLDSWIRQNRVYCWFNLYAGVPPPPCLISAYSVTFQGKSSLPLCLPSAGHKCSCKKIWLLMRTIKMWQNSIQLKNWAVSQSAVIPQNRWCWWSSFPYFSAVIRRNTLCEALMGITGRFRTSDCSLPGNRCFHPLCL